MAWKLNFSHYFLCSRREPAVGWPMTWMLESRRNFLINFRDCFSIKLFMFVCHPQNKKKSSNAIPVSGPEFQSTFATCNCTLGDFEAYLRCATMRQSPDSANRPQEFFHEISMYRYKFPFLRRYWIQNYIHNNSLFAPIHICRTKKMLKSFQLWSRFIQRFHQHTQCRKSWFFLSSS